MKVFLWNTEFTEINKSCHSKWKHINWLIELHRLIYIFIFTFIYSFTAQLLWICFIRVKTQQVTSGLNTFLLLLLLITHRWVFWCYLWPGWLLPLCSCDPIRWSHWWLLIINRYSYSRPSQRDELQHVCSIKGNDAVHLQLLVWCWGGLLSQHVAMATAVLRRRWFSNRPVAMGNQQWCWWEEGGKKQTAQWERLEFSESTSVTQQKNESLFS